MTKLMPLIVASTLYVAYQYYSYNVGLKDEKFNPKEYNPFCTFIYYCGVLRIIYLFDYKILDLKFTSLDFLLQVTAINLMFEFMNQVIWASIESLFLNIVPYVVDTCLEPYGLSMPQGIQVAILFGVVCAFYCIVANNFDVLIAKMMLYLGIGELEEDGDREVLINDPWPRQIRTTLNNLHWQQNPHSHNPSTTACYPDLIVTRKSLRSKRQRSPHTATSH